MKHSMPAVPVPPEYQEEFQSLNAQADSFHRQIPPPLSPEHAQIHLKLGIIYFKIGDYREAEDNLTRSSQMNPDSPDVHLYLGRTFSATHHTSDAVEEYQTSLRLDPNQPEAHKELGDLYQSEGMTREAEAEYQASRKDVTPPPVP
jgi:Tfp pilus assembly protein PilF